MRALRGGDRHRPQSSCRRPQRCESWTSEQFVAALRHDPSNPAFNPHLRQLLHVGYKVAAKMGGRYLDALDRHAEPIARNVTDNLYHRHIKPIFVDRD